MPSRGRVVRAGGRPARPRPPGTSSSAHPSRRARHPRTRVHHHGSGAAGGQGTSLSLPKADRGPPGCSALFFVAQPFVRLVLREARSFVGFEAFEHRAHVPRVEDVGTSAIAQRVDLAAQALGRRTRRSLRVLARHVQPLQSRRCHDFARRPTYFQVLVRYKSVGLGETWSARRPRRRAVGGGRRGRLLRLQPGAVLESAPIRSISSAVTVSAVRRASSSSATRVRDLLTASRRPQPPGRRALHRASRSPRSGASAGSTRRCSGELRLRADRTQPPCRRRPRRTSSTPSRPRPASGSAGTGSTAELLVAVAVKEAISLPARSWSATSSSPGLGSV